MTNNANVGTKVMGWCVTGVAIYIVSGIMIARYFDPPQRKVVKHEAQAIKVIPVPEPPEKIILRHLNWASDVNEQQAFAAANKLSQFFSNARQQTRKFAEEALSFNSKWTLITDFVTRDAQHVAFLRERFEIYVFSQGELEEAVKGAVRDYIKDVGDLESTMLLRMKADLANLPETVLPAWFDQETVASKLDEAVRNAVVATQADVQAGVGIEIASYIAGELLTQATIHIATSSGILGTGALSGPATFGVSVIVGIIVDQIVSEIYNRAFDPVGDLAMRLNWRIEELEQIIVCGTRESPGLIRRLDRHSSERSFARGQEIHRAVLSKLARSNPNQ